MVCQRVKDRLYKMADIPSSQIPKIRRPNPILSFLLGGMFTPDYRFAVEDYKCQVDTAKKRKELAKHPMWQAVSGKILNAANQQEAVAIAKDALLNVSPNERVETFLSLLMYSSDKVADVLMEVWQEEGDGAVFSDVRSFGPDYNKKINDILDRDYNNIYSEKQKGRILYSALLKVFRTHYPIEGNPRNIAIQKQVNEMSRAVFDFAARYPNTNLSLLTIDFLNHFYEHGGDQKGFLLKFNYVRDKISFILVRNSKKLSREAKEIADKYVYKLMGYHLI